MTPVLIPTAYMPPIAWVALCVNRPVILESREHFIKQTFRNRASICGANGRLELVVPVSHEGWHQKPVCEVRIADDGLWKSQHWKSIGSAYRNAPYFEYYEADLEAAFHAPEPLLFSWNLSLMQCLFRLLEIEFHPSFTAEYKKNCGEGTWDVRDGKALVQQQNSYNQVFMPRLPFVPGLSVLDILFNLGPKARFAIAQQISLNGLDK